MHKSESVGTRTVAESEEEKEIKKMGKKKVEGKRFHELDTALVCDEFAG